MIFFSLWASGEEHCLCQLFPLPDIVFCLKGSGVYLQRAGVPVTLNLGVPVRGKHVQFYYWSGP